MTFSSFKKHLYWIVPLVVLDIVLLRWWLGCGRQAAPSAAAPPASTMEAPEPPPSNPWERVSFPTDQKRLLEEDLSAFQPTASGRPESALYGTTRTAMKGSRLMPSFHEGIDIAATARNRAGRPLDAVYAVAGGRVAYINRVAGNSNYGLYVVLTHPDPVGEVYSLYAHLASVEPGLSVGQHVNAGETLGRLGNTPASIIPMERAHVHLEIGLILNARFPEWYRAKKLKPDHAAFNGRNLLGADPLAVFRHRQARPEFSFKDHLATLPRAFELLITPRKLPDFFRRYPSLWKGPPYAGGPMVLACCENGIPLEGRSATEEERALLGQARHRVLMASREVLGRNGRRLVVEERGAWRLGQSGQEWLEILTY